MLGGFLFCHNPIVAPRSGGGELSPAILPPLPPLRTAVSSPFEFLMILLCSWEYGTAVQAILELDFPDVSVYGPAPFPPPRALDQADYPVLIGQQ